MKSRTQTTERARELYRLFPGKCCANCLFFDSEPYESFGYCRAIKRDNSVNYEDCCNYFSFNTVKVRR